MRRYEDFLSRWKHVIGHYYSEHKQSLIEARGQYTWAGSRDALEKRIQQELAMNGNGGFCSVRVATFLEDKRLPF